MDDVATGAEPPSLTVDLLEGYTGRLREQGAPVVDLLRPGLSEAQIDELTAPLGLRLPSEARLWWGWHDGADVDDLAPTRAYGMTPLSEYVPLGTAVDWHRQRREIARDVDPDEPDFYWQPSWFPVALMGNVACDCAVGDEAPVPILDVDPHHNPEEPGRTAARSFGEMVTWWIGALDTGGWRYDRAGGRWERDTRLLDVERMQSGLW